MIHGDNKGLVLPPRVAPIQVFVLSCLSLSLPLSISLSFSFSFLSLSFSLSFSVNLESIH